MKDDVIFRIPYVWNKFPYDESLVIHTGFLPYGIWCMDRKPARHSLVKRDNIAGKYGGRTKAPETSGSHRQQPTWQHNTQRPNQLNQLHGIRQFRVSVD